MKYLSVIIPAYNEEKRLPETLQKVLSYLAKQNYTYEVIVVDDGSTDKTFETTQKLIAKWPDFQIIKLDNNAGKGAAVRAGMLEACGEHRLFMDADNSTDVGELKKLLPFAKDYPVVIGSRYLKRDSVKIKQSFKRQIVSRWGNLIIRIILGLNLYDTQCGFKLFSREATEKIFPKLISKHWVFDIEVLLLAEKCHFEVLEVPVNWFNSRLSKMQQLPFWQTANEMILIRRNIRLANREANKQKLSTQVLKFALVGVSSTLIDWAIYFLLTRETSTFYLFAKSISFIISAINSYYLNRLWTFESTQKNVIQEFAKFLIVSTIGLVTNTLILKLAVEKFHWSDLTGLALATLVVMFWNFSANKLWVFKVKSSTIKT